MHEITGNKPARPAQSRAGRLCNWQSRSPLREGAQGSGSSPILKK
nr:MAG TPA: hypothetical protein [Caudoviricetes sp.]